MLEVIAALVIGYAPPSAVSVPVHGAQGFHVVMPSVVRTGESVEVRVLALDGPWSVAPPWHDPMIFHGVVLIRSTDPDAEFPRSYVVSRDAAGRFSFPVVFRSPGVHRIEVVDALRPLVTGESNPAWVSVEEPLRRLYWGDLHGHTCFSDGSGGLDHYLEHARDESFLDFVAVTDHADEHGLRGHLDEDEWSLTLDKVAEFTQPEQFLAFAGFEWTSNEFGHRHVVYRDPWGELLSNATLEFDEPEELYGALKSRAGEVLIIPHHTNHGHLMAYHDPELEPILEVYSRHGSSETCPHPLWRGECGGWSEESGSLVDMLRAGRRVGVIGSGDSHDGFPGRIHGGFAETEGCVAQGGRVPSLPWQGGLAGVMAPELTPNALFGSLVARAALASTGPRFLLLLRIEIIGRHVESRKLALEYIVQFRRRL